MPWQNDGTFIRVNPDYEASPSGELWGKDLKSTPSIKIIASRHDWHDQDLGQGIQECLNINGLNQMASVINMGGNKIVNLGTATQSGEAATWNKLAASMTYDSTILRLFDNDGSEIDNVQITTSGGGGGTVTSLTGVAGQIVASPSVITETGSFGLAETGISAGAYASPSSISVDIYGRITQIIAGSGGGGGIPEAPTDSEVYGRFNAAWVKTDQSLDLAQTTETWNTIAITSAAGGLVSFGSVQLNSASQSTAGLMRGNDKLKLDNLPDAADAPDLTANNTWTGRNDFNGSVYVQLGDFHAWNVKSEMGSTQVGLFSKGLRVLADGSIQMPNLPVSTDGSGLTSGTLYRDGSDFIKIA